MAHGASRRSDLLLDALALIRQDRDERRADCAALRDELSQALNRVSELQDRLAGEEQGLEQAETMYQFVEDRIPAPGADAPESSEEEPPMPPQSSATASLDELQDDESNSLQDFVMTILATSDRAMHVDEVVEAIVILRARGRTEKLGNSKRPSEDVRTALNRLVGKGRVEKVAAATYAVARDLPTAQKAEAA
ncbi:MULTISPECIES: hypothetical protein [Streptomyces]|uniref:Uncharacterized protein n=1 Tax=Streptomyces rubiginosohelvolus TaxID=67362 RepID=A0ABQ3C4G9_9ACTN|nr:MULTISPECIES: hypothetical protein [Streptomyces]MDQ0985035.1 hypothetical protein [Streptomyces sp. V2I9]GGS09754.1 hypothetical protein GCM10010284_48780 [Streptomyces rubiginosohelvolus]GGZ66697.1 hypothetical protein GCM10010328_47240 [Streptomyces pluricolorescens]